jgi:serine/threonine protein kinase
MIGFDPPDLVLLDITMPEMDGYEVCARLKDDERTRPVPVIFLSALDDVLDKIRAFKAGGVDYVTKPFETREVLARVESQLKIFHLQSQVEERNRELERKNAELAKKNEELARKNDELARAHRTTNRVFSALAEALPGTVLDEKYRLDVKIGSGGFGTVFRATNVELDLPIAVKVFRPSPGNDTAEALARFRREGNSACRVNHPNAVQVMDFGISSTGIAYLVMELLRGFSLSDTMRERGRLPLERCVEILLPVCDALAEAHASRLVHRDIKPDNIFLHQTKRGEVVKVLDFGIAKLLADEADAPNPAVTETGGMVGTPEYMSPECVTGLPCDGRSDVYSVGVMLYRMLSGTHPLEDGRNSSPYLVALRHVTTAPRPLESVLPGAPAPVGDLLLRALAKDPTLRPTARDLGRELAALVG